MKRYMSFLIGLLCVLMLAGCSGSFHGRIEFGDGKAEGKITTVGEGKLAIATEDMELAELYIVEKVEDGYSKKDFQGEYLVKKNDLVVIEGKTEDDESLCIVKVINNDAEELYGVVEESKLSFDEELIKTCANQALAKDIMSYDGVGGNEIETVSGRMMILERKEGFVKALMAGGEECFFKEEELSYDFDLNVVTVDVYDLSKNE